ncbi:MAG: NAD(P)-binding domain-containing protein [Rickettsiales bacterium]|nr:NAD(P)-binding domain-containing protein [Rickettsiales bacterium]
MTTLANKQILFLGTGEMGQPCLVELLKRTDVNPTDVTIITGTSAGKDKAAVEARLEVAGISPPYPNMTSRTEVKNHPPVEADIVILAVKPNYAKEVLSQHKAAISDNTTLISMAAGKMSSDYLTYVTTNPKVVRIMPHLPKAAYALYGTDEEAIQTTQMVCGGLGEGFRLEEEDVMHGYTGAAGSMPAFIARFIDSFANKTAQKQASEQLRKLASNTPTKHEEGQGAIEGITKRCTAFYKNGLKISQHYLDDKRGEKIFQATLAGTLDDLSTGQFTPETYIEKVRSKKGTTNAGLLYMGSKPPQDPAWGTQEQLSAQNAMAIKYDAKLKPENAITYAVIAAAERSAGAAQDANDPLYGIDDTTINALAEDLVIKLPNHTP